MDEIYHELNIVYCILNFISQKSVNYSEYSMDQKWEELLLCVDATLKADPINFHIYHFLDRLRVLSSVGSLKSSA